MFQSAPKWLCCVRRLERIMYMFEHSCRGYGGMLSLYNLIRNNDGASYIPHNIRVGLCYEVPRLYFYGQA